MEKKMKKTNDKSDFFWLKAHALKGTLYIHVHALHVVRVVYGV